MVRHYYILMAHCLSGAPLVSIPSIALFLVVLTAAQNNYVLDAPLGDRPIAGADADVMNV